jgi:hypothetical protein
MSDGTKKANSKEASGSKPGGENTCGVILPKTACAPAGGKSQPDKAWYEQVWDGYKKAALDDVNADLGEPPDPLNKPKGGWEILGAGLFGVAKDAADNPGGGKGRMPSKAVRTITQTPKIEPDKKPKSKDKPEAEAAGGKGANGGGGAYAKARVKQKPHEDCGKQQPYSDKKGVKGTGLEKDHTPSAAALRKAAMREMEPLIGKSLTIGQAKKIASAVANKAPTIAIPKEAHAAGNTYKGKNNPTRIESDSRDLNGAAKRDTEKVSDAMADQKNGCSDAYEKAAKQITSMDWNKVVKDTIADKVKGK